MGVRPVWGETGAQFFSSQFSCRFNSTRKTCHGGAPPRYECLAPYSDLTVKFCGAKVAVKSVAGHHGSLKILIV
jgi:hypothetical protein